MYETLRIVEKLKPKFVLWENVKNVLSKKHRHNFDNYLARMQELGYENYYQVLNAKDYGIPQNRERVFTISILNGKEFKFPEKKELKLRLKDMLENNVNDKYYLSDKMINFFYKNEKEQREKGNGFRFGVSDGNVIAKSVTTRAGGRMDDNLQYPESTTRRGRVGHQVSQTLQGNSNIGVVTSNNARLHSLVDKITFEEGKVLNMDLYNQTTNENISQCLTEPHHNSQALYDDLRIRKLTPKECFRLMRICRSGV